MVTCLFFSPSRVWISDEILILVFEVRLNTLSRFFDENLIVFGKLSSNL